MTQAIEDRVEDKVEGIGFMSFRVFWFVVAGFVLGFVTSTLWEWLYYRQKRVHSLASHGTTLLDARRSYVAEPEDETADSFDVNAWKLPSYRSSGVLLESEELPIAPNLAGVPALGSTQPKPANVVKPPTSTPESDKRGEPRPFVTDEVDQAQEAAAIDSPTAAQLSSATSTIKERGAPASASLRNQPDQASAPTMLEHRSEIPAKEEEVSTGNSQAIARASALAAATLGAPRVIKEQTEETKATTAPALTLANDQEAAADAKSDAERSTATSQSLALSPAAPVLPQEQAVSSPHPLTTQPFMRRPTDYPDDLAMIKGIGEAYKRRLYASGIYTWMQLAESDTDSLRRITRAKPNADIESWQTQARTLAEKYQRTEANFAGPLDDFTRIEGIGAITADMLYKAGICVYEQLAALLPDELARIVPAPTVGNENDFDGWVNDATRLATAKRRNNGLLA